MAKYRKQLLENRNAEEKQSVKEKRVAISWQKMEAYEIKRNC